MKEKLTIQEFLDKYNGEYVMNCDTEEKARKFLTLLDSIGRKWNDGDSSYLDFRKPWVYWSYGEKTCYDFNKGMLADVNYYISLNYTILKFEDFEFVDNVNKNNFKTTLEKIDEIKNTIEYVGKITNSLDAYCFNEIEALFDDARDEFYKTVKIKGYEE